MKCWEIIADNLSKAGWSWGCVSAVDSSGRTIWIVDAHRDDGKRFIVHADEKLTAFWSLKRRFEPLRIVLTSWRNFLQDFETPRSESGRERFSRQLLSLFQTCSRTINQSGAQKPLFYENENFTHNKFDETLA